MQTAAAKIINSGPVRCSRKLTRNGNVMVFPGQTTDPAMQIAWRKIWRSHFSINLYEALNLPRGERMQDYLLINEGDFVSVSEPIARCGERKNKTLTALKSGRYLGMASGNLIFESDQEDLEIVTAGFPGIVTEIIEDRGAIIETSGAFAAGIWGNNISGQGILLTLNDIEKDGIFTADSLSMAMSGSIVFANTCYDKEVLQATARLSPGGLIFGSLPSDLLPIAANLPFPVIITDTIGSGRISDPIYQMLGNNIIKCAYLYSAPSRGNVPQTVEIIIPQETYIPAKGGVMAEASVGCRVRILEGYYAGEIGCITELLPEADNQDEQSQAIGDQVLVCIDEDTVLTLPITNIELLQNDAPIH